MIRTWCSVCGHGLAAKAQFAGRKVRCPRCGTPARLPSQATQDIFPPSARHSPSRAADATELLDGPGDDNVTFITELADSPLWLWSAAGVACLILLLATALSLAVLRGHRRAQAAGPTAQLDQSQ